MNWMSMSGLFMNEGQWPKHYEKHPTTPFMGFIHQHKKTGGHDLVQIATSRFQDSLETVAVSVTEGISGFGRPLYMETCTAVAYRLYVAIQRWKWGLFVMPGWVDPISADMRQFIVQDGAPQL